jgi:hypothetical protein
VSPAAPAYRCRFAGGIAPTSVRDEGNDDVSAEEPVTSPDQHKPGHPKAARAGAVLTIIALLLMMIGNHHGRVEDIWLGLTAAAIAAILVGDWALRKNGLKS